MPMGEIQAEFPDTVRFQIADLLVGIIIISGIHQEMFSAGGDQDCIAAFAPV